MTNPKMEKFERVAAPRIAAASKALDLLPNLIRSEYDSTIERRTEIVTELVVRLVFLAHIWQVPHALEAFEANQPELGDDPAAYEAYGAVENGSVTAVPMPVKRHVQGQILPPMSAAPIEGHDKRDIREVLTLWRDGHQNDAFNKLRSVVLGWSPEGWGAETPKPNNGDEQDDV